MIELNVGDLLILNNKKPIMVISKLECKRFECKEGNSNKFWEIFKNQSKRDFITRYGVIGNEGSSNTKSFSNETECSKEYDKIIREKLNKGYIAINSVACFIYVCSSPTEPGKKQWISYNDLDAFIKKNKVKIQRNAK